MNFIQGDKLVLLRKGPHSDVEVLFVERSIIGYILIDKQVNREIKGFKYSILFNLTINKMKKCYRCEFNLPLFLFYTNNTKHKIASDKGKTVSCRFCTAKQFKDCNGEVVRFNFTTKKFYILKLQPTILNTLRIFFKNK